jgi:hypothetical protein
MKEETSKMTTTKNSSMKITVLGLPETIFTGADLTIDNQNTFFIEIDRICAKNTPENIIHLLQCHIRQELLRTPSEQDSRKPGGCMDLGFIMELAKLDGFLFELCIQEAVKMMKSLPDDSELAKSLQQAILNTLSRY